LAHLEKACILSETIDARKREFEGMEGWDLEYASEQLQALFSSTGFAKTGPALFCKNFSSPESN